MTEILVIRASNPAQEICALLENFAELREPSARFRDLCCQRKTVMTGSANLVAV